MVYRAFRRGQDHTVPVGFEARLLARNGVVVLASAISPYRQSRDDVRKALHTEGLPFVEVFVRAPLAVLIERDVKGLYKKAIAGEIKNFTGISDPYEEPESPSLIVDSAVESVSESAGRVLTFLSLTAALVRPGTLESHPEQRVGTDACEWRLEGY